MEIEVMSTLSGEEIRRIIDPHNTGTVAVAGGEMPEQYFIAVPDFVAMIATKAMLRLHGLDPKEVKKETGAFFWNDQNYEGTEDSEEDSGDDQETDQYGDTVKW